MSAVHADVAVHYDRGDEQVRAHVFTSGNHTGVVSCHIAEDVRLFFRDLDHFGAFVTRLGTEWRRLNAEAVQAGQAVEVLNGSQEDRVLRQLEGGQS